MRPRQEKVDWVFSSMSVHLESGTSLCLLTFRGYEQVSSEMGSKTHRMPVSVCLKLVEHHKEGVKQKACVLCT